MKLLLAIILTLIAVDPCTAEPLTLTASWTPGDTLQKGFKLYWGKGGGIYEESFDVGNVTKFTHQYDFAGAAKVCWIVKAYNDAGESPPSNEYCMTFITPTPTATATVALPKKPVTLAIKKA